MRVAVFDDHRIGVIVGDGIHDVSALAGQTAECGTCAVGGFIAEFGPRREEIREVLDETPGRPLSEVVLRAPVPRPTHVLAAPLNYPDHQAEMTDELGARRLSAAELGFFLKATGSVSGPSDPIRIPDRPSRRFDHEGEVAVVIGREARAVSRGEALGHVFGYTLALDVTMRRTPEHQEERSMRKSYHTFTPLGPWVVTADEIPDPSVLSLRVWVNGELRQDASLSDLIVDVPDLIAQASSVLRLQPGDVYLTGSPAGVGPIEPGDRVVVEAPEIGRMELDVVERGW